MREYWKGTGASLKELQMANAVTILETEKNNTVGKTRDLFKKIGGIEGTFHEKMGTIKDWNGKNPTEAEEIKKRWLEYTEKLQKKVLMT